MPELEQVIVQPFFSKKTYFWEIVQFLDCLLKSGNNKVQKHVHHYLNTISCHSSSGSTRKEHLGRSFLSLSITVDAVDAFLVLPGAE